MKIYIQEYLSYRFDISNINESPTCMIIKKKKKRKIICTKHSTASDTSQFTKTIKIVPIPYSIKAFHRKIGEKRGGRGEKKKIFSTLCEQCLRGAISRNMKTASKSDGGRSEIGKQRFAQSCARKA